MKKYIIRDTEAGNEIDSFSTIEEAQKALVGYVTDDRRDGSYTTGFYEIYNTEGDEVVETA